jgi:branched-chain amino acid aminotransferase
VTVYSINGFIVPESQARISVEDLSVIRGYGVFDYLRTYNRVPFRLKWHIDRFFNSAAMTGLKINFTPEQVTAFVNEAVAAHPPGECAIRLVQTGGVSPDSITPVGNGHLNIIVKPAKNMPLEWYEHGAAVSSYSVERFLPGAKTINYLMAIVAQKGAHAVDAIEAIYVSRENKHVLEGTTSNIVFIKDEKLIVPGKDILEGVSARALLSAAEDEFKIEKRNIFLDEVAEMDEMIICSSNREVVPIVKFDNIVFGDGKPGPISRRLMEIFSRETMENPEGR